jgi:hypothetical protein
MTLYNFNRFLNSSAIPNPSDGPNLPAVTVPPYLAVLMLNTLQRQNTEISKQIFPEKEYRGLSPNFHIHASVNDLQYIFPLSVCLFC